jgi:hypothetical protein
LVVGGKLDAICVARNVIVAFLVVPQSGCPGESWTDLSVVRWPLAAIVLTVSSLVAVMSASLVVRAPGKSD